MQSSWPGMPLNGKEEGEAVAEDAELGEGVTNEADDEAKAAPIAPPG